jgi:hypothetical protein
LPAVEDEHLFVAATREPRVDQRAVARPHAPRMFTERGDAGVCFKTNPLVETEVVERANGPTELGAEGG